jgi:UDP-N-acetylmuramoylalanine-D-glutamate ligase
MAAYASAKANILRYQTAEGTAVLAADDPGAMMLKSLVKGRLRTFSLEQEVADGAFVRGGQIWLRNGKEAPVCRLDQIRLRGEHNAQRVSGRYPGRFRRHSGRGDAVGDWHFYRRGAPAGAGPGA